MQDIGVDKQGGEQRPDSALFEIAETKDQVSLGERRILLPRPEAGCDARKYQQRIGLQGSDEPCIRIALLSPSCLE